MRILNQYSYLPNLFKKKKISKKALMGNYEEKYKIIKTHKNDVSLIYFLNKKNYRKFNKSKKSLNKIKSEYKGLKWYCLRTNKKINKVINEYYSYKNFSFIDTKKIEGFKCKSWNSLEKNFPFLIYAFKHYLKYYPRSTKSYIHGDFTLDNLLFKKESFVIDWEFFSSNKNFRVMILHIYFYLYLLTIYF